MKTNLGKKSLLVLIASVSMLTACDNSSDANRATAGLPKPQAENASSQPSRLPDSVTGIYADSPAFCEVKDYSWEITPTKLIYRPSVVRNVSNITAVASRDGVYDITADSYGIESTEEELKFVLHKKNRRYQIVPDPQGNKIELSVEDLIDGGPVPRDLVLCKKR